MASAPSTALAPSIFYRLKSTHADGPAFGCEHVQRLLSLDAKTTHHSINYYVQALKRLSEKSRLVVQTSTPSEDGLRSTTFLRPTYMCMQCSHIGTLKEANKHWRLRKHNFAVDSRSGCLYCHTCQDLVYDPCLEEMRLGRDADAPKPGRKKRKLEDLYPTTEDLRYVSSNSNAPPCKALGLRGLHNMGMTCYMGVILQCLAHNPILRNYYLGDGHRTGECTRENCLNCALDEMFAELWGSDRVDGYGAVNVLGRTWALKRSMAGYKQHDAHEYFQFLVDHLHAENIEAEPPEDSSEHCPCIIHKTFSGQLHSDVTCRGCNAITTTQDPMMDLSLDLRSSSKKRKLNRDEAESTPSKLSLQSCLESFTAPEKLGSDSYRCKKCHTTQHPAVKQLSIKTLPPVLCIQFKRFEAGFDVSFSAKLNMRVDFPMILDMSPFTLRAMQAKKPSLDAALNRTCTYDLASVVVHKGSLNDGHYVSYHREGGKWYLFDDTMVSLASEAQVLAAEAYLLVYTVQSLT